MQTSIAKARLSLLTLLAERKKLMNTTPTDQPDATYDVIEMSQELIPIIAEGDAISPESVSFSVANLFLELSNLEKKVESATERALAAQGKADKAAGVKLGFWRCGDKTEAIKSLQEAMVGISASQIDQSDAIKAMLEYQGAISRAVQYMLLLGAANMASNRTVYRLIEAQMRNASKEELSEMARQEFKRTLVQLKQQQDFLERQERIRIAVGKQKEEINHIKQAERTYEEELARQHYKDVEHDAELERQRNKDSEHDEELARQRQKDAELAEELVRQRDKEAEHDLKLAQQRDKDVEHDRELARQRDKDAEHDAELARQRDKHNELDAKLARQQQKLADLDRMIDEIAKRLSSTHSSHLPKWVKIAIIANIILTAFLLILAIS